MNDTLLHWISDRCVLACMLFRIWLQACERVPYACVVWANIGIWCMALVAHIWITSFFMIVCYYIEHTTNTIIQIRVWITQICNQSYGSMQTESVVKQERERNKKKTHNNHIYSLACVAMWIDIREAQVLYVMIKIEWKCTVPPINKINIAYRYVDIWMGQHDVLLVANCM